MYAQVLKLSIIYYNIYIYINTDYLVFEENTNKNDLFSVFKKAVS